MGLDLTVARLPHLHAPGPNQLWGWAHVPSRQIHAEHVYRTCIYTYTQLATQITDAQSVHTNTDCTSVSAGSLLLLSSMEVHWQKYINICTHRYIYLHVFSVDAFSSWAQCGIWASEPPRQQPCSSGCTDHCVHTYITCTPMHTYTQLTSIPLVPPTNSSFCSLARWNPHTPCSQAISPVQCLIELDLC